MIDILYKFSWDTIKFDFQVLACMIVVWIAVLVCAISSIISRHFPTWMRVFWISLIVCLPAIGLLFYLPFALKNEGGPEMLFAKRMKG